MNLRITVLSFLLVMAAVKVASAQTPPPFSLLYNVDISALSTINPNTDRPGSRTDRPGPKNGCATQPLTQDAKIWSVDISLRAQAPGLRREEGSGRYVDTNGNVFYFMFSGNGPTITLSSSRRDYSGSVNTTFAGEAILSFDKLTLADLGDLIEIIDDSQGELSQAFTKSKLTATMYRVSGTRSDNTPASPQDVDQAVNNHPLAINGMGILMEQLRTATRLSLGMDPLSRASRGEITVQATQIATQLVTTAPSPIADSIATARNNWKLVLRQGSLMSQTFVIDEPCLQFGLAPVLNENKLLTGVDLKGRYDFLSIAGTLYSKFRLEGQLPLNSIGNAFTSSSSGSSDTTPLQRPYFQRLNITNASGYQKKAKDWILSAGSLLSYSSTRNQDQTDNRQWQAGGRFQVYAPNLTGILSKLPGAGTSPIIFFDVAATHGSDPNDKKTHVAAVGNLALTVRPSIRASLDLLGKIAKSPADAFGPYSHFAYGQAQLRFNLSKEWDYLLRYSCGRQDPDYHKFCGWQSGITLALGR